MHIALLLTTVTALWSTALCQPAPFDAREATIASVHEALFSGRSSCRAIVSSFIARIEQFDGLINSIVSLNPDVLHIADTLDRSLSRGNTTGSLFCIPILLKDNFDALPMATTGGCLALRSSFPSQEGPTATALRRAGAVILGKTNMHELALEGLSVSSLGGQTVNPYDSTRTPGGSSGGTGAAIAASFAVLGTCTDTVNSCRSPASANSLFSFRPTRGLISRSGIIPVSYTQDTVGAIGRSVQDVATALTVMASTSADSRDNATAAIPPTVISTDYSAHLSPQTLTSLTGLRIGILNGFFNLTPSPETTPVNRAMDNVLSVLARANTSLIPITDTHTYNTTSLLTLDVQRYEYRDALTTYLSSPHLLGPHPKSTAQLYLNTTSFLVIPQQYPFIHSALSSSTSNTSYHSTLARIANLTATLHTLFTTHDLDAVIYPEQSNLVVPLDSPRQSGRNGIIAALTGFPVVTVPLGFSESTTTAALGVPIGMEILGLPWSEEKLLRIAKGVDENVRARRPPQGMLGEAVEMLGRYESVPVIKPRGMRREDARVYQVGVF